MDQTCKLWEANSGKAIQTLSGHDDEILDVTFDHSGKFLATASADGEILVIQVLTPPPPPPPPTTPPPPQPNPLHPFLLYF